MRDSERGFTLIELLVAMVLFAFLTAMLAGGLDLATRRYQGQYSRLERAQRVALVESFLRAQLSGARAIPDRELNRPGRGLAFDGAPDRVRFIAAGPESVNVGGLADLTVEVESATQSAKDRGGKLVVRWRSFGRPAGGSPRESVLLDRVRRADFAYFGTAAPNEPPGWHGEWRDISALPSLVRLSLVFDDGSVLPELVVAIETATGPGG